MLHTEAAGLLAGALLLGAVHGIEPGHGWPVAATYALDRSNKWLYGLAASLVIGVGHLVSSIAMVVAFFYAKAYFDLTAVNDPITVVGGVQIGGPVSLVAGILLVLLGAREYFHGQRSHTGDDHAHSPGGHTHANGLEHRHRDDHDDGHSRDGLPARVRHFFSSAGGRFHSLFHSSPPSPSHSRSHGDPHEAADRGLFGIAWFAFVLGFAHEEEFEIIALCAGSIHCLELMAAYALTVLLGIVVLTMTLIAGYEHFEERVERCTPYLPLFSAVVLVAMGVGFIVGLF